VAIGGGDGDRDRDGSGRNLAAEILDVAQGMIALIDTAIIGSSLQSAEKLIDDAAQFQAAQL